MNQKGTELVGDTDLFPVSDTHSSDPGIPKSEETSFVSPILSRLFLQNPILESFELIIFSTTGENLVSAEVTPSSHIRIPSDHVTKIITQTQDDVDSISVGSNGNDVITIDLFSREHGILALQLNSSLDDIDDYFLAEFSAIISHKTESDVLELKVEYNNSEHSWYCIDLVMNDDPQATTHYVTKNDLGKIYNNRYRPWARLFLCPLKLKLYHFCCYS